MSTPATTTHEPRSAVPPTTGRPSWEHTVTVATTRVVEDGEPDHHAVAVALGRAGRVTTHQRAA